MNKYEWEEELDEGNLKHGFPPHPPWLKAFISKTLQAREKEIVEAIEKMKLQGNDMATVIDPDMSNGYNFALEEVINLITSSEKDQSIK